MANKLNNYLRTYRKRAGLSQEELSYLLGAGHESKVSRYEESARQPRLETLLAYEAVFGAPPKELYAGLYEKVEQETKRRAARLVRKLANKKSSPVNEHKLASLRQIAGLADQPNYAKQTN